MTLDKVTCNIHLKTKSTNKYTESCMYSLHFEWGKDFQLDDYGVEGGSETHSTKAVGFVFLLALHTPTFL